MSTAFCVFIWLNTMENNLEFAFMVTGDSPDIFSGTIGVKLSRSIHQLNRCRYISKHRILSPFPCHGTRNENSGALNIIIRCEEADYFLSHIERKEFSWGQSKYFHQEKEKDIWS